MMDKESVIRAFTADHVVRLTGLSQGQLRSWDRDGFFRPEFAYEDRGSPYSRIYSFRDVVGLRTIAVLKTQHKVSLQELRKVAARLAHMGFEHWADTKLYVVKRQVHFQRPGSDSVEGVWDHQLAMLPIIEVIQDVRQRIAELQHRPAEQHGKVGRHRYVARNSAVIAGTRIPVAAIRRYAEAGYSVAHILREYPTLTEADVKAALSFKERVA
jgi:uncharacterized protein (DUF433 family)